MAVTATLVQVAQAQDDQPGGEWTCHLISSTERGLLLISRGWGYLLNIRRQVMATEGRGHGAITLVGPKDRTATLVG